MQLFRIYEQRQLCIPGVYRLANTVNGKSYVGEAQSVAYRIYTHCQALNTGKHRRAELQTDWNEYGWRAFQFEVLRKVNHDRVRLYWEAHYMTFGGFVLYNCARDTRTRELMTKHVEYQKYVAPYL